MIKHIAEDELHSHDTLLGGLMKPVRSLHIIYWHTIAHGRVEGVRSHNAHNRPHSRYNGNPECALCDLTPFFPRAETLTDKPYFRDAFKQRRCLVPAGGYYEWRAERGGKQPYFIRVKGAALFSFAGLWSSWQGPDGPLESFTVITTAANEALAGPTSTTGCRPSLSRTTTGRDLKQAAEACSDPVPRRWRRTPSAGR